MSGVNVRARRNGQALPRLPTASVLRYRRDRRSWCNTLQLTTMEQVKAPLPGLFYTVQDPERGLRYMAIYPPEELC